MKMPAWTFSRLEAFATCPKQFYHKSVARDVVEAETEPQRWGTAVHTAFENRIGQGTPLPTGMTQWEPLAAKLGALPGEKFCEIKLALDDSFKPCDYKQSWCRGIADLFVLNGDKAAVADYKTGKRKPSDQLDMYAAMVFAQYPAVQEVQTKFIWLREKKFDGRKIARAEAPQIWQSFLPAVKRLERAYEEDKWPENPSGLCRGWCPCTFCKFWKPKK